MMKNTSVDNISKYMDTKKDKNKFNIVDEKNRNEVSQIKRSVGQRIYEYLLRDEQ